LPAAAGAQERRLPPTPLTEDQEQAALVRRCVEGDSAAWADLVRLHNRRVYNICYRFTGSPTTLRISPRKSSSRSFALSKASIPAKALSRLG
jgi:hypothetical protein